MGAGGAGEGKKQELIYEPDFEVLKVIVGAKKKNITKVFFVQLCVNQQTNWCRFLFSSFFLEAWVEFAFWPLKVA